MKTVGELKKELEQWGDNLLCYAYEGESAGIVIVDDREGGEVAFIECPYETIKNI